MVFLVRTTLLGAENIGKEKETDRRKTLKNEEKKKRRMQENSNNNNKHLWIYLTYKEIYFARKHSLKRVAYT